MKTIKTPKTLATVNPSTLVGTKASLPKASPASLPPKASLPTLPTSTPNKVEPPTPAAGGKVAVNVVRTADATLASDDTLTPKGAFPSWATVGTSAIVVIFDAGEAKAVKVTILAVTPDAIVGDDGTFATSGEVISVSHPRDVFPATSKGRAEATERAAEATAGVRLQRGWADFRSAIIAGVSNTRDEVRLRASLTNLPRVDRSRVAFALTGSARSDTDACVAAWKAKGAGSSDESRTIREAARATVRAFRAEFPNLESDVERWGSMAVLGTWGYPPKKTPKVEKVEKVEKVAKTPVKKVAKTEATPTTTPTPTKVAKKAKKSVAA